MQKIVLTIILITTTLSSCILEPKKEARVEVESKTLKWKKKKIAEPDSILNLALEAHGVKNYEQAAYSFNFRGDQYTFITKGEKYEYQKKVYTDTTRFIDYLKNGKFFRLSEGREVKLSDKESLKHKESLNSVLYFATLPHKLTDKAVKKRYLGTDSIKNQNYHVLEVTFDEIGGGEDHEDEFYYWINADSHKIDYLAYKYNTNNGGVRFRAAYNIRSVDGISFQDYVNYKANPTTALSDLPELYERDSLKELSRIEITDIIHLPNY